MKNRQSNFQADKRRAHFIDESALSTLLAIERSRFEAQQPVTTGRGPADFVILWLLIGLQIIMASAIIISMSAFGRARSLRNDIASFDLPFTKLAATPVPPEQIAPQTKLSEPAPIASNVALPPRLEPKAVPSQPDSEILRIRGLEITQGIQVFDEPEDPRCDPAANHPDHIFCNNSVPLVAGRRTLLRLYLACQGECPQAETTIELRVLKENEEQTRLTRYLSAATLSQINNLPHDEVRLNLGNSVNFEFSPSPSWLSGSITFEVEAASGSAGETPVRLDLTENFAVRKPLRIAYLPIQHQGLRPAEASQMDHWLVRLYPTPNVEYYRLPVPDLIWDRELNKGELLNELLYVYWLYTQHHPPADWPDQLFGWLPQEIYNGGASDPSWCPGCAGPHSGRVAFGGWRPEQDIGGPRILVHEIAHNLGAKHAWSPTEQEDGYCFRTEGADIQVDPQWPYVQTPNIQEVGIDLFSTPPIIYPASFYDVMSYCSRPWISPHTYRILFDSPVLDPDANRTLAAADFKLSDSAHPGPTLLVSGMIYPDDTVTRPRIVHFDKVFNSEPTAEPVSSPLPISPYCLEIQADDGSILARRCFEAGFLNIETGLPTDPRPYFLAIPNLIPEEIASIRLSKNGAALITVSPSATPPQVALTYPNMGEPLRGRQTITWEASDADGDPLTYDLLYSHNGGQSWTPIATGLEQNRYTFDAAQLTASHQARIRVFANDGFHTRMDETDVPLAIQGN